MPEHEPPALQAEQPALLRRDEAGGGGRALDQLDGRVRQRGRGEQRGACVRREAGDPALDDLPQALRHRQRRAGFERRGRAEGTRDLQREQRVAARRLGDALQDRPPVAVAEPRLDQAAHRLGVERPEPGADEPFRPERALQPERVRRGDRCAQRRQHADPVAVQAPDGEGQRPRGRRVEPLDVVDGEHERRGLGRPGEQRAKADGHGRRVGRARPARPPHQRDL